MSRRGIGQVALLAALVMNMADGLGDMPDAPKGVGSEHWKRKKWQKGPSAGSGGPEVRMKIPRRRKP